MIRSKKIVASLALALSMLVTNSAFATSNASKSGSNASNASKSGSNTSNTSNAAKKITGDVLVLASINDFHGNLEEDKSEKGKNPGLAKVAGAINELKAQYGKEQVHFFSSGDQFQGTAISNLTNGDSVNVILKEMGIEASAIGNHEYDWGKDRISAWAQAGGYEFLAANIVNKETKEAVDYAKPYMIKEYTLQSGKKVKVGFIGIATPETQDKTLPENVKDIEFTNAVEAANKCAEKLRNEDKVDAVVALTHLGIMQDKETKEFKGEGIDFAKNVKGVDVVFTGHTHQTVDTVVNNVKVLQGYYSGRALSVATLEFDKDGKLVKADGYVDDLVKRKANIVPDEKVNKMVETFKKELSPILDEKLGTNASDLLHNFDNDRQVTDLGQWAATALKELGETQIGYINGGGIRTDLKSGDITMGAMYSIFPFDNTLVTMELTGAQLKTVLEHGLFPQDFKAGQFAGIMVTYDKASKKVTKITLEDGTEVTDDGVYTVATLDFLATGGDGYKMLKEGKNIVDTFKPVRDLLVEKIKKDGKIDFKFTENLKIEGASSSSNSSNTSKAN